jgi:soluble lytic murein transglycosylase-like protein
VRFFVLLIALVVCASDAAYAAPIDAMTARYAQALRAFNPKLSPRAGYELAQDLIAESDRAGVDARLVVALVAVESRWHAFAVSPAGAIGLGQLMPATAQHLGVDPNDPVDNLRGTVAHLAYLIRTYAPYGPSGRYVLALSAYNAGEGAVARYGGMPPYAETRAYVRDVVALWRRLAGA